VLILIAVLALSAVAMEGSQRESDGADAPEIMRERPGPFTEPKDGLPALETILASMERVASTYLNKAVTFTADERTEVLTHFRGHVGSYVAPVSVYCFRSKGDGQLDDYRIEKSRMSGLKKRLARSEDISEALSLARDPLRNNSAVPVYVVRPYTWIVLFSREARSKYLYRIEGAVESGVWLSLRPADPNPDPSDWYGDVLVDLDTFQILEARGHQHTSVLELGRARAMLESDDELPTREIDRTFVEIQTWTKFNRTAYGIRFPSKVLTTVHHHTIVEPVSRRYDKRRLAYEVIQKFKRYEFYGVRVREHFSGATPR
jgi:hypothetical protein